MTKKNREPIALGKDLPTILYSRTGLLFMGVSHEGLWFTEFHMKLKERTNHKPTALCGRPTVLGLFHWFI